MALGSSYTHSLPLGGVAANPTTIYSKPGHYLQQIRPDTNSIKEGM